MPTPDRRTVSAPDTVRTDLVPVPTSRPSDRTNAGPRRPGADTGPAAAASAADSRPPVRSVRVRVPRLVTVLTGDWTVSVHDGPVTVCSYPPLPLWSAWSLARAARRCWPDWQARLTPPPRARHG
jgi:hypothetical protein